MGHREWALGRSKVSSRKEDKLSALWSRVKGLNLGLSYGLGGLETSVKDPNENSWAAGYVSLCLQYIEQCLPNSIP